MVSWSQFLGLTVSAPKVHGPGIVVRGSHFWCTESCTKRWALEAHFQMLRLAGAIARKWLSPAVHILVGDGTWRGVEPPPPRFRLLSLRHTPSTTLNLGGGTSFFFSNKALSRHGRRRRRRLLTANDHGAKRHSLRPMSRNRLQGLTC